MSSMTNEQKELLQNILANKEFLTEILKAATQPQKKTFGTLQIGDTVTIADITWRKFKEDENGNSYMLADDIYAQMQFGETNDWKESYIREKLVILADKIKKEIGDMLVPITTDLLSHDGLDDYGTYEDLVSILTYDLYRHNRKNILYIRKWFWLATPDSTDAPTGCGRLVISCVGASGGISCGYYYNVGGVRPFFILRSGTESTNL